MWQPSVDVEFPSRICLTGSVRVRRGGIDEVDQPALDVVEPEDRQGRAVHRIRNDERRVVARAGECVSRDDEVAELTQIPRRGHGDTGHELMLDAQRVLANPRSSEIGGRPSIRFGGEEVQVVARSSLAVLGDIVAIQITPGAAIRWLVERAVRLGQHQVR
jgi:hypothetical protein